jgi:hypothetical protein
MKYTWREDPYRDEINDGCLQLRIMPTTNEEMAQCERAFTLQRTSLTFARVAIGETVDYCISFDKPKPGNGRDERSWFRRLADYLLLIKR